jgi:hypothetical protein
MEMLYDLYTYGAVEGAYNFWDSDHLTMCVCDMGYTGPGCEMKMCPKGDDPLTTFTDYRTISITTSASTGTLYGSFKFTFNTESFSFPANADDWSAADCETSFASLRNVNTVRCTKGSANSNGGATYIVQFVAFSVLPYENNIYYHGGNPSLDSFSCSTSSASDGFGTCTITDSVVVTLPEYEYCSNRGTCDFNTGECTCYSNFENANCDTYNYGVRAVTSSVNTDILNIQATRSDFSGNVLKLHYSGGNGSTNFNMLQVIDATRTLLAVDGNGNIDSYYGGLTIHSGGLSINGGGFTISGGMTIFSQGMKITGGLTVNSGGLRVLTDGMLVTGGLTIYEAGLKVDSGGITIQDSGLSIYSGGLVVSDGGLTVTGGGFVVGGSGLTINAGGLSVTSGITINTGGLYLSNTGITVNSGGATISGGVTIHNDGLRVTGGVTVNSGGLVLSLGGLTINTAGLVVTGGITMNSGTYSLTHS